MKLLGLNSHLSRMIKLKQECSQKQETHVRKNPQTQAMPLFWNGDTHLPSFSRLLRLLNEIFPTKIQYKHGPSKWVVLCLLLLPLVSARDGAGKHSAPSTMWAAAGKQQKNSIFVVLMWSYQIVVSDFFHPYPQCHFSVSHGITDGRPRHAVWSSSPPYCSSAAFSFTVIS